MNLGISFLFFLPFFSCCWQVCREQFVALHSQPILQDLSKFLLEKYCSEHP